VPIIDVEEDRAQLAQRERCPVSAAVFEAPHAWRF
jgi:hypothetical protein